MKALMTIAVTSFAISTIAKANISCPGDVPKVIYEACIAKNSKKGALTAQAAKKIAFNYVEDVAFSNILDDDSSVLIAPLRQTPASFIFKATDVNRPDAEAPDQSVITCGVTIIVDKRSKIAHQQLPTKPCQGL